MNPWRALPPSSQALLVASLVALLAFAALHLAGLRESVTVLSGTVPVGSLYSWSVLGGLVYLTGYLVAVLVAPVLAIWALLIPVLQLVVRWG